MARQTTPQIIIFFLIWRAGLFVAGAVALLLLSKSRSLDHFFDYWFLWDGLHYLKIAQQGYGQLLDVAFFPLLPLITRLVVEIAPFGNWVFWGLSLANAFTLLASVFLYKLFTLDYDRQTAIRGVLLLLAFPSSFFLGAYYSESLLLLLSVVSLYSARKGRWAQAGFLAFLASLTRPIGIMVSVALFVEYRILMGGHLKNWRNSLWLLMGPAGLATYCVYLLINFGDPLAFFNVQIAWNRWLSLYPWEVIAGKFTLLSQIWSMSGIYFIIELAGFVSAILFIVLLAPVFLKLRLSYFVLCYGLVFLPLLTGTMTSMFRFVLMAFPVFLLWALWVKDTVWLAAFLFMETLLLTLFTLLFIGGFWVS